MTSTLLVGASGLVGQAVAQRLHRPDFDPVWLLVRREVPKPQPHHRVRLVNFQQLGKECGDIDLSTGVALCTLGTTLRKAGSKSAFQAIDRDRVVHIADWCRGRGARHFMFVSSLGANPESRNLYLRTKGETEQELMALDFERLTLLRPALLVGKRREFRLGESLAMAAGRLLQPVLRGPLLKYRPVPAAQVAAVLTEQALQATGPAIDIWESDRISRYQPGSRR